MSVVAERVVMRFGCEPYSEKLIQEMRPLWLEHAYDVGENPDAINPNLTLYANSEKLGMLRVYTARVGAGWESTLVGYQVFFVMPHPHRQEILEASQDILFLDRELRKGLVAVKFMKWADEQLRKEGVQSVARQIRTYNKIEKVFERMGYDHFSSTFRRVL